LRIFAPADARWCRERHELCCDFAAHFPIAPFEVAQLGTQKALAEGHVHDALPFLANLALGQKNAEWCNFKSCAGGLRSAGTAESITSPHSDNQKLEQSS
jgi:hypothetical protein